MTMETHYLFHNCNASNDRNRGGGLPFWRVFMDYRKDKPTADGINNEPQYTTSINGNIIIIFFKRYCKL